MRGLVITALAIVLVIESCQDARNEREEQLPGSEARNQSSEELREHFQGLKVAGDTWQMLKGELETNSLKDERKYQGKEVLVAGFLANRGNPVQVTIWKSEVRCLVYLKDAEVNSVAHYPADAVEIQVRGTIRSVDVPNRQVEIMSTESSVVAAD